MHSAFLSLLALAALLMPTQALYFYIDGPSQKCFFEELPKDTLVVGELYTYYHPHHHICRIAMIQY